MNWPRYLEFCVALTTVVMKTIFGGCQVILDLTTSVSFKKKLEIRKKVTENDGIVSYIVTKKVSIIYPGQYDRSSVGLI